MYRGDIQTMPITVQNLVHIYSKNGPFERTAINDVSFSVNEGEFVGLIGHTGSGKSTLIQHLNGLIKPHSGSVVVDGIDITEKGVKMKDIRSKVGIVFQYPEYQLFEETVYKDIAFGPLNIGKTQDETDKIVRNVIKLVGLGEHVLHKSPFELSGGEKRRVAIAGVLAMEPKYLILDEPTSGLDPLGRKNILNLVLSLHKDNNITIILVSHSMEDIARVADRVMVMDNGNLVMFDTVSKVFSNVEKLKEIGLDVPEITRVVYGLKKKGIDLGDNIYTVEDAKQAIIKYKENRDA